MPSINANGVSIEYEVHGAGADRTMLLVNGLGSQLIAWDLGFCRYLVDRGFQVLTFDNRDVGLTSKSPVPLPADLWGAMASLRSGTATEAPPYTLADMAADGIAVLDAVGVERAHVVGMSMGGMIVQRMAIDHPDLVLSMTSIMSTTGDTAVGQATPAAMATLSTPAPSDRDGYIEHTVANRQVISGSHYDPEYWRQMAPRFYDRSFHPPGPAYQLLAIAADGDRTAELRQLRVPTLVIHGRLDPLVTLSGGEATAAAVPGAELLVIDEMGHDIHPPLWAPIGDAIAALADRA
ncbi:MAG: alpha/beta hydrolase [Actinomycetota bacterium]|nr:alpha/beta hydrolase [Actinomycetota bacterium]